jgi:hypothetical protein
MSLDQDLLETDNYPLVSYALHTGKLEFTSLVENLVKSFLICNTYPNIELILIESAGNESVRNWFSSLDFDTYFSNFDGSLTTIKKSPQVSIKKELLFLDYRKTDNWHVCYMESFKASVRSATGKYFLFTAEDSQFIAQGNMLSDYITLLKHLGEDHTLLHLLAQPARKFHKPTNRYTGPYVTGRINYFTPQIKKPEHQLFVKKSLLESWGEMKKQTNDDNGRFLKDFQAKMEEHGVSRIYPAISIGTWINNSEREFFINVIRQETLKSPDFVLFNIHSIDALYSLFCRFKMTTPITVEDLLKQWQCQLRIRLWYWWHLTKCRIGEILFFIKAHI